MTPVLHGFFMARRKKRRRKGNPFLSKIKILTILGASSGVLRAWDGAGGDPNAFFRRLVAFYTGVSPNTGEFNIGNLKAGLFPLIVGAGGSFMAAKTGINRYIPFASSNWRLLSHFCYILVYRAVSDARYSLLHYNGILWT